MGKIRVLWVGKEIKLESDGDQNKINYVTIIYSWEVNVLC